MSKRKRQQDASTPSKTERITDDVSGDIVILWVGNEKLCFETSRCVLEQVPWFRTFVSQDWPATVYSLPDDDPELMRVVLNVLHHKLSRLPPTLTAQQLFELATLCEKYDLAQLLVPHVETRSWIEQLWQANGPVRSDWWMWVWILEAFYGSEDACPRLGRTLDVIACNMSRVDGEWVFQGSDKECAVSAIEHRSRGDDSIVAHMQLRRQKLWEAFRLGCEDLQQTWLQQQDPSFRNIGLMVKLLQSDAPEELPPETSLTMQLSCIQQKLIATYRVFGEHPVRALLLKHIRRVRP